MSNSNKVIFFNFFYGNDNENVVVVEVTTAKENPSWSRDTWGYLECPVVRRPPVWVVSGSVVRTRPDGPGSRVSVEKEEVRSLEYSGEVSSGLTKGLPFT